MYHSPLTFISETVTGEKPLANHSTSNQRSLFTATYVSYSYMFLDHRQSNKNPTDTFLHYCGTQSIIIYDVTYVYFTWSWLIFLVCDFWDSNRLRGLSNIVNPIIHTCTVGADSRRFHQEMIYVDLIHYMCCNTVMSCINKKFNSMAYLLQSVDLIDISNRRSYGANIMKRSFAFCPKNRTAIWEEHPVCVLN